MMRSDDFLLRMEKRPPVSHGRGWSQEGGDNVQNGGYCLGHSFTGHSRRTGRGVLCRRPRECVAPGQSRCGELVGTVLSRLAVRTLELSV